MNHFNKVFIKEYFYSAKVVKDAVSDFWKTQMWYFKLELLWWKTIINEMKYGSRSQKIKLIALNELDKLCYKNASIQTKIQIQPLLGVKVDLQCSTEHC